MIQLTGLNSLAPTIFVAGMIWMSMTMFHLKYYLMDNHSKLYDIYSSKLFGINWILVENKNKKDKKLAHSIGQARLAFVIMVIGLILVIA